MSVCRKPYPSDISDEEWSLVVPYLLLQREDAGQRQHDPGGVHRPALHRGDGCAMAVDTLGHLLALHVTSASADDRGEVERLARTVQAVTGDSVNIAWVDQGHTGERAVKAAASHGIVLEVVRLPETKRGFVLLPRRWVAERSFA